MMRIPKLLSFMLGSETGDPAPVITSNPEEVGEAVTLARAEFAKMKGDHEYIVNRLRQDVEDFRQDLTTVRASLETSTAEVAALKGQLATAENSAEEKARELLRKSGHGPIAPAAEAATSDDPPAAYTAYMEMPAGGERLKFYNQNRAAIDRADKAARA